MGNPTRHRVSHRLSTALGNRRRRDFHIPTAPTIVFSRFVVRHTARALRALAPTSMKGGYQRSRRCLPFRLIPHWNGTPISGSSRIGIKSRFQAHFRNLENADRREGLCIQTWPVQADRFAVPITRLTQLGIETRPLHAQSSAPPAVDATIGEFASTGKKERNCQTFAVRKIGVVLKTSGLAALRLLSRSRYRQPRFTTSPRSMAPGKMAGEHGERPRQ